MSKELVAYFSAAGITAGIAQNLAAAIEADIYEIKPEVPYTKEDLDYINKKSRSCVEMNDLSFRPAIVDDGFDISGYDRIFLGFPIWWYLAPTIVNTFLEKHDFAGKTIVLFATSGGSEFDETLANLKPSAPDAKFREGEVLTAEMSAAELKAWANDYR